MKLIDKVLYKFLHFTPSYAQCGEDKILEHLFYCYNKSRITYLDIGTNHPIEKNNTYLFYRNGSRGICVEPNLGLCAIIKRKRPEDVCLNIGISNDKDSLVDFYIMTANTLSTFSKEEALELDKQGKYKIKEVVSVQIRNINSIIAENFTKPVDLVSIDVEGWNEEIVASFDFGKQRPFCFCVETLSFSENNTGIKLQKIFKKFEENNYSVYADTNLNTIFIDNLQK